MTRSPKGNKANFGRNVGDCWQCKQLDNVLQETHVVSIMRLQLLPAPNSKATKDGKGKSKSSAKKDEGFVGPSFHAMEKLHQSVLQTSSRESELHFRNRIWIWHKLEEKPVAMLKELAQTNCVSQDLHPKKKDNWEAVTRYNSHEAPDTTKIMERKGPSPGIIQKCEPHERSPCAQKICGKVIQQDTLQPAESRGTRRKIYSAGHALHNCQRSENSCLIQELRCACEQKRFELA